MRCGWKGLAGVWPVLLAGCATTAPVGSIPVAIRTVGDDRLSTLHEEELRAAFDSSPGFRRGLGEPPGTLIVYRPGNVLWRSLRPSADILAQSRYDVRYTLAFYAVEADGVRRPLGTASGWCWLGQCAAPALRAAVRFGHALRTPPE